MLKKSIGTLFSAAQTSRVSGALPASPAHCKAFAEAAASPRRRPALPAAAAGVRPLPPGRMRQGALFRGFFSKKGCRRTKPAAALRRNIYPLTAPETRPLIMYFWKKKNTKIMGMAPSVEAALISCQSLTSPR